MHAFKIPLRLVVVSLLALLVFTSLASAQISVPVGTTSSIQTAFVQVLNPSSGTVDAPTEFVGPAYALTSGNPSGDFQISPYYSYPGGSGSNSSCTGQSFGGALGCAVNYTVTPSHPGLIKGAIQILDQFGNPIGTTFISAIGTGPQLTVAPTAPTAIQTGFFDATAIAIDGSGNLDVADYSAGTITQITNPGTPQQQSNVLVSNPNLYPDCLTVAADGSILYGGALGGNALYILQATAGAVSAATTPVKIASGNPCGGMVTDAVGNLWIAEEGNGIWQLGAGYFQNGNTGSFLTQVAQGVGYPSALALDPTGNIYFVDQVAYPNKVQIYNPQTQSLTTLANTSIYSSTLAFDAAGDLFVGGFYGFQEFLAVNGTIPTNPTILTPQNNYQSVKGLAIAPTGDLYYTGVISSSNLFSTGVYKLDYKNGPSTTYAGGVHAPAYTFADTIPSQTSSDSPYTFALANNGNQPLVFGSAIDPYGSGNSLNFEANEFSLLNASTCPVVAPYATESIAPGAVCTYSYSFHPDSIGLQIASFDMITNSLHANSFYGSVDQFITLFGTGSAPPTIPITVTANNITVAAGTPASTSVVSLISGFTAPGYTAQQIEALLSNAEFGITISGNGYSQNYPIFQNGSFVGATLLPAVPANAPAATYTVTPYLTGAGASAFTFTPVAGSITITAAPTTQPLSITAANVTVFVGQTPTQTVADLMASYSAPGLTGLQLEAMFANVEVGFTVSVNGGSYNIPLFSYGTYYGANLLQMVPAGAPIGTFTLTPYLTGPGASQLSFSETPGSLTLVQFIGVPRPRPANPAP